MTHAARTHDAIDRLTEMRERLDEILAREIETARALENETRRLEARIAIANAQSILSKLLRQSTVTDADRLQIKGVKDQLARMEAL